MRRPSADSSATYLMQSGPGPRTIIDGRSFLYFGGTGYLGLQTHPQVIKAAQDALARYGTCSATSRIGFGTTPLYLEVEETAARFFDTEDSAYLAAGYLVNAAGVQALARLDCFEAVFVDEGAHWSIADFIPALRVPVFTFAHGDPQDLAASLRANLKPRQRPLVATDGVFPTFGRLAPVPEYLRVVEPYDGCLWLDDCHGIGVLGLNGRGTCEHFGLRSGRVCFGGTTSKALGAHGGIIPGDSALIGHVRGGHVASGANAPSSAAAAAAVQGMKVAMAHPELREQLWRNARRLKAGLTSLGFHQDDSPVPIAAWALESAADMDRVHAELMRRGFAIQRTRYISGGPSGLLRAVVFATHQPEDVDELLRELKAVV